MEVNLTMLLLNLVLVFLVPTILFDFVETHIVGENHSSSKLNIKPVGVGGSLSFIALGDWGGQSDWPYTTPDELACAKQMGILGDSINSSFVLALGDNFYEYGITTDVHDKRFKETFEDVFTARSLQNPWYVLGGNHDHLGNITAELEYTKLSTRWTYPFLYYSFTTTIPGTETSIAFIMVDTVVLCGVLDEHSTPKEKMGHPRDRDAADVEWAWLEEQLQHFQDADYLIVAGHYPVWSIAEHGPTDCLVSRLGPMLIKYNVSAYLCGHDHNLQHIRETDSTVEYFVIGAGHVVDSSRAHKDAIPPHSLRFYSDDPTTMGGFAYMNATSESIQVTFAAGLAGKDLYVAYIKPRVKPQH